MGHSLTLVLTAGVRWCYPHTQCGIRSTAYLRAEERIMIDLKNDGDVAVVTVRHGKANALDIELCEGLAKCFEELRRSDARAVVVTGQGRMFSAGVDLIRLSSAGADYVHAFLPYCTGFTMRYFSIRSR